MPDQQQIDLEMRLGALEYLLGKMFSSILKGSGKTDQQINGGLDQIAEHAAQQKFPGLDPALSDLASAEFGIAVKKLTDAIKAMAKQL
jgi:hypothetical protein